MTSVADTFEEFTSNLISKAGPKSSPIVGYGTFCDGDPDKPSKHKSGSGSTGGGANACPPTRGVKGTGSGTDYDKDWPIEEPPYKEEQPCAPGFVRDVNGRC